MNRETANFKIFFPPKKKFEIMNIKPLVGLTGLYFIFNGEIQIQYPFKSSRLIYVGMSEKKTNSIGNRLNEHFEGKSKNWGLINYNKINQLNVGVKQ